MFQWHLAVLQCLPVLLRELPVPTAVPDPRCLQVSKAVAWLAPELRRSHRPPVCQCYR